MTFERPRAVCGAPHVSVVVPAFNEARRIASTLERIVAYMSGRGEPFEVLVVNDGSRDRTADLVRDIMKRHETVGLVSYETNRGKGYAVRTGMLVAAGKIRLFTDADESTPIEEFEKLRAKIVDEGYDIAIGSRMVRSPGVERKVKLHRSFMSFAFYLLRRVLLDIQVLDSQCGFKACTAEAAEAVFRRAAVDGFAFDVEMLYLARKLGLRIAEVAVNWYKSEDSKVSLISDPIIMVKDVICLKWRWRSGLYS